jgi:hypothetical protein
MLLAVAVIAVIAFSIREWVLLRDAREQFNYVWAGRNAGHETVENVVLTSARLMKAEVASPWISERGAQQLHVERMNKLLKNVESPSSELHPATIKLQASFVRREIDKFHPAPTLIEDP